MTTTPQDETEPQEHAGLAEFRLDGVALAAVDGELDLATAPLLAERLRGLLAAGCTRIVLDVAGVSFCDSSGLNVLLDIQRRASRRGGSLTLVGLRPNLARVLDAVGLTGRFDPASAQNTT
ncbi:STAS domain-containing protein [Actinomadura scrupuli]|uniref:STAS domain-containing protein n=1 Tax=Actinomadura scrupuli TaxID=559629 RepID=UPI003D9968BF